MRVRWGVAIAVGVQAVVWMSASAIGGDSGGGATRTLASVMADPLSLLAKRSPGGRGPGAMLSSKPSRALTASAAPPPTQRVLSRVRDRPVGAPVIEGLPPIAASPAAGDTVPLVTLAQPDFLPGGGSPLFGGLPIGQPGGPGFGGGVSPTLPGAPGGGPVTPVVPITPVVPPIIPTEPTVPGTPVTPVVPTGPGPVTPPTVGPVVPVVPGGPVSPPTLSPVPEPASWMIMLMGFFAVGWSIRRAGARALRPQAT